MWRALIAVFAIFITLAAGLAAFAWWPGEPLPVEGRADQVVVLKSERKLILKQGAATLREYRVALGFSPVGAKEAEGDGKTPEGSYLIDYRNVASKYHRSLHISYPSPKDIAGAKKRGVSPGGMIMIHGLPDSLGFLGQSHRLKDWTLGCIAVTNAEIEEIWQLVPDGTPIDIRP